MDDSAGETIIGGRYALAAPVGAGGMAAVHVGRLVAAGGFARIVAIKRVRRDQVEQRLDALLDEARLASRIHHPNVVAPLDMVIADEDAYLVMEFVPGVSLAELLAKLSADQRRLPPAVACSIVTGVLLGLEAAHEAVDEAGQPLGIVHRDVSPDNVLIGADGLARILDFGVAKGRGRLQASAAGHIKGKIGYTAPEVLRGEEAEPAADVYSAAVVLWEALTGERLYTPGQDRIAKILEADIEPPSSVVPSLPRPLNATVMRGLEPTPETRYPSAAAFAEALEPFAVATQRQVAQYLADHATDVLAARTQLMRSVEASGGAVTSGRREERAASSTIPEGPGVGEAVARPSPRDQPRPLAKGSRSGRARSKTALFDPSADVAPPAGERWSDASGALTATETDGDPHPDAPVEEPRRREQAAVLDLKTDAELGGGGSRRGFAAELDLAGVARDGRAAPRPAASAQKSAQELTQDPEEALPVAPSRAPWVVAAVLLLILAIAGARFLL